MLEREGQHYLKAFSEQQYLASDSNPRPGMHSIVSSSVMYEIIAMVAGGLNDGAASLGELHARCMQPSLSIEGNDISCQVLFALVGIMTGLWQADPMGHSTEVAIINVAERRYHRTRLDETSIMNTKCDVNQIRHLPLHVVAQRFGSLIPRPNALLSYKSVVDVFSRDPLPPLLPSHYVSCRSLKSIGIKVQWTNTLAQHLEFDRHRSLLYLFSRPSIQVLGLKTQPNSLIRKLVGHNINESGASSDGYGTTYEDFVLELLLSYRLIFANSKTDLKSSYMNRFRILGNSQDQTQLLEDPFLRLLGRTDAHKPLILGDDIEIEEVRRHFTVNDYPYFGARLRELADHTKGQSPQSLRQLWLDRRNPTAWFALWAVFILGAGTILLQFIQVVLQAYVASRNERYAINARSN